MKVEKQLVEKALKEEAQNMGRAVKALETRIVETHVAVFTDRLQTLTSNPTLGRGDIGSTHSAADTSGLQHTGPQTHQVFSTPGRRHIRWSTHRAADTSGRQHTGPQTHQVVNTPGRGHIRSWTHRAADTSGRGHTGPQTHLVMDTQDR